MHASAPALHPAVFEDGLGKRHHAKAPNGELLEVLELRDDLTTDAFEGAVRDRAAALDGFETSWFAQFRTVQRIHQSRPTLFVVYDRVPGARLSTVLDARRQSPALEVNATLYLIRQVVAAIALLHERLPGVTHGAIAAERVFVTPDARVVVADHVLGLGLEQIGYPPARYWKEMRIALPPGQAAFDQRVDVMQIGVLALELMLGRRIEPAEYPRRLEELAERAWRTLAGGAAQPLPAEFRNWLFRMLQFDADEAYASAVDAWADLEIVLGARDNGASFIALEAVMADFISEPEPCHVTEPEPPPVGESETPHHIEVDLGPELDSALMAASLPSGPPIAPESAVAPALAASPASTASPASLELPELPELPEGPAASEPSPAEAPLNASAPSLSQQPVAPVVTPAVRPEIAFAHAEADATQAATAAMPVDLAAAEKGLKVTMSPANRRWIAAAAVLALLAGGALFGRQLLLPSASAEAPGTLVVTTNPAGFQIFVDGQPRGVTPVTVELAPGSHELKIATEGEPRIIPFTVAAGSTVAQTIEIPKAAPLTGELTIRSEPAGARVTIDDIPNGTTPVTIDRLTPGPHTVTVQNDLSTVTQNVTIEPGIRASLVVPMTAPQGMPVSGWISVAAPAEVQVYEEGRLLGTSQSDRIMVSAGQHTLEIVNEPLGYRATRSLTVAPGKVSAVRLDWPNGSMALNAQPWAEVWVNGKPVGETPIGSFAVPVGTHEVTFRHPQLGERVVRATVTATAPARVSVDLRRQ